MSLTWKMGSWIAVGCVILMEGTAIVASKGCPNDYYQLKINTLSVCCPPCKTSVNSELCSDAEHRQLECQCSQGYGCNSQSCTKCEKLPICYKTSPLERSELQTSVFQYRCDCPMGTYYEAKSGICKPSEKQSTTKSSKDGIYSSVPSTQDPERSSFNNWTSPYLWFALAAFILLLLTVAIHLIIWKMKAAQLLKTAGEPFQPQLIINRNAKEDADSWSCQYPEEEHGEEHGNGPVEKQYV